MAKLIEMNIKEQDGSYEVLYPKTTSSQVIYGDTDLNDFLGEGDLVTRQSLVEIGLVTYFQLMTWQEISDRLAQGETNWFNVGDYKSITLNGTVASTNYNNVKAWAIIIGINHNSSREGNNRLHLQISLNQENTQLVQNYQMNTTNTNVGGWKDSYMRNTICSQFLNCLPNDLNVIVKNTTKYTDNYGNNGQNEASHVTSTTDKIFLLSEYEIFGTCAYSNTSEANYQQQYAWYQGLSNDERIKYQYNSPTSAQYYWERSPHRRNATDFCRVASGGNTTAANASNSHGFAPCLCI